MKKILTLIMALLLVFQLAACAGGSEKAPEATPAPTASPEPTPEPTPTPVYAHELENGVYEISVDSSSSMFRVVKCLLTVEDGSMSAAMTMSGNGYGMVYMGTGEQALADSEDKYIPFVLEENGAKTFTVPVEALNVECDCAAWSIRKEKWYDRVLVFEAEEHMQLIVALMKATEEGLRKAAKLLCQWLNLKDENARMYVEAVVPQLTMWIGDNVRGSNLESIFV